MTNVKRPGAERSPVEDFECAIKRATKVLKGSSVPCTPYHVSKRAVMYLRGISIEYLRQHILELSGEKRAELGVDAPRITK
jgi:hypothetical protein